MNFLKSVWKNKPARIWSIVTVSVLVFVLTVSLVITQVGLINETLNTLFGGPTQTIKNASEFHYKADYRSKTDALAAANALSEQIMGEGAVLLKNEGNALPLAGGARISVFGKNSVNLVHGGTGSGEKGGADLKNLYDSLNGAGFAVNPALKAFYENNSRSGGGRPPNPGMGSYLWGFATGETSVGSYDNEVKSSYASDYKDAALVVFSRIAGEGYDLPRSMKILKSDGSAEKITGAAGMDDHYLQLDENESALLKYVGAEFSKVIVIINSSAVMELGFLDDPGHYAYSANVKGALWIGNPGGTGIMAVGRILKGEINPSGHLTDTWMRDATTEPSWQNFSFNLQTGGNQYRAANPKNPSQINNRPYYFVDYEEGIYAGYRYWETRGYTQGISAAYTGNIKGTATANWDNWYKAHVVYPMGHGLSYSGFSWALQPGATSGALLEDGTVSATVRVTNNGELPGKDVVQLYYSAPYKGAGKIEKPHIVLGAFQKTAMIAPGGHEDITISVKVRDMASYDYNDANGNGETGYELDPGAYTVYITRDAYGWADPAAIKLNCNISEEIYYPLNEEGKEVKNLFDDAGAKIYSEDTETTGGSMTRLSRANWTGTWPAPPTADDRLVSEDAFIASLVYPSKPWTQDVGEGWYSSKRPAQSQKKLSYERTKVKLYELLDENFKADYNDSRWEELLDQLTVAELAQLIGNGNFHTQEIESIVKPRTIDPDGPVGFTNFMELGQATVYETCFYVSATVVASTWNTELAFEQGKMVGNEGIFGNQRGDKRPYSGWYAPAVNIHRSPFSGRNWEYYSEDGLLSGKIAAGVIQGALEKGVYTYVKHFAINDQETNRDSNGLVTWVDEQTMREIYLKPFELAVKEGGTRAIMSSFNRIGKVWAGGSYALLTELLRNEWGFRGMVITDYNVYDHMPADQMIRAGGDLNLMQDKAPTVSSAALTPTQVTLMRKAVKNILYTIVNSNAMNGLIGARISYQLPGWQVLLIVADIAIGLGLASWGFFVIRKSLKKDKAKRQAGA